MAGIQYARHRLNQIRHRAGQRDLRLRRFLSLRIRRAKPPLLIMLRCTARRLVLLPCWPWTFFDVRRKAALYLALQSR